MLYARQPGGQERFVPTGKGQRGECPNCGSEVIAKFGEIVRPHWAHRTTQECDSWSEGETEWHLGWKALAKREFCEVTMKEERDGVWYHHRADMVGDRDTVIELQHSPISPETIREREAFYGRMIWVVDASGFMSQICNAWNKFLPPEPSQVIWATGSMPKDSSKGFRNFPREWTEIPPTDWGNPPPHDYRGWILENRRLKHTFQWKHAKKSWLTATAPIYLDFGVEVGALDEDSPLEPLSNDRYSGPLFRILSFKEAPSGTYITGRFVSRHEFYRRYMRTTLADQEVLDQAIAEQGPYIAKVQEFRKLGVLARKYAEVCQQKALQQKLATEAAALEKRRREEEAREREARIGEAFSQKIKSKPDSLYNDLCFAFLNHNPLDTLACLRANIAREHTDDLVSLEDEMVSNLRELPVEKFDKGCANIVSRMSVYQCRTFTCERKFGRTIVKGPFFAPLKEFLKEDFGFEWSQVEGAWSGSGQDAIFSAVHRLVDVTNHEFGLEAFPLPKQRFLAKAILILNANRMCGSNALTGEEDGISDFQNYQLYSLLGVTNGPPLTPEERRFSSIRRTFEWRRFFKA